jgi:hypothetical protein
MARAKEFRVTIEDKPGAIGPLPDIKWLEKPRELTSPA